MGIKKNALINQMSLSIKPFIYSLVLLFVKFLIHPLLLTFTPSTLLPTWHALPLLDLFHLMTWKRWPIRFRHLSAERAFTCSTTVLGPLEYSFVKLLFNGKLLHCSIDTFEETLPLSHDPTPLFSNLIDINDSAHAHAQFGIINKKIIYMYNLGR